MALEHPARVEETLRHLPPGLTATDRAAIIADLDSRLPARVLVCPARLLLGWSSFALLLFVACRTVSPGMPLGYLQFLALEIHCESAGILGALAMPFVRRLFGDPAGPLLNSLNIFTLWYVVLLAGGVSVLCATRPLKAALVVLLVWGSSLAFHTAVLRLLRDALHLAL